MKESRKDLLLYIIQILKLIFDSVALQEQFTFCIMGQLVKKICEVLSFNFELIYFFIPEVL